MKSSHRIGFLYALAAAVGLGAITTQAKLVYADGGNAFTLMFWRFVMSVAVIGLLLLVRRVSFRVPPQLFKSVLLLGLVWSGAMISYLMSVQFISVSIAVLILYSYPLIVLLIGIFSGKIQPNFKMLLLFFIAFAGIGLMLMDGEFELGMWGVALASLAALGATYTFIVGEQIAPKMNPIMLTFWVNLVGLILIIPLVFNQFHLPESAEGFWALAGATACYIAAIICQFQALSRITSEKAAFILNTEPVVSIVLAMLILNESLTTIQWVGVLLVMVVLFLFTLGVSRDSAEG